jgi:predicted O-methyltransferase YrrM
MEAVVVLRQYDFSDDWFGPYIPTFQQFLANLRDQPCRLLEIGAHEGRSAIWLLENIATHDNALIETIDAWEYPKLRANIQATERPDKVQFHLGRSFDVLRTLPRQSYDFVYIDGSHWPVNVLEDAVLSFGLLKRGGIMAFDDYLWNDKEWNQQGTPRKAIDAFLSVYAHKIEVLHFAYQVWVRKLSDSSDENEHSARRTKAALDACTPAMKKSSELRPRHPHHETAAHAFGHRRDAVNYP